MAPCLDVGELLLNFALMAHDTGDKLAMEDLTTRTPNIIYKVKCEVALQSQPVLLQATSAASSKPNTKYMA